MLQNCSLNLKTISNFVCPVVRSVVRVNNLSTTVFCRSENNDKDGQKNDEEPKISQLLEDSASFNDRNNDEWATKPYPTSAIPKEFTETKPKHNPIDNSIILFPGQGIIRVGDVKQYLHYPRVKELFSIANDILGYDLLKICKYGPQSLLNRTEFNQPATVVTSLAAIEKLQEERPRAIESCVGIAGYSVGELTALIFSGAVPYEEGLKLVGVRATAMQAASEMSPQGMLSCFCSAGAKIGNILEQAQKWALDMGAPDPVCKIAVYMYSQGKVIAGSTEALDFIEKNGKKLGLRSIQRLSVNGAFHTNLMEPAVKPFKKALTKMILEEPNAYVYSNFTTNTYSDNNEFNQKILLKQLVRPVKWEQIMQKIYNRPGDMDYPRTFDLGSKGNLKTLLKRINAKAADSCYVY